MGRNNQQRRAAKKRQERRHTGPVAEPRAVPDSIAPPDQVGTDRDVARARAWDLIRSAMSCAGAGVEPFEDLLALATFASTVRDEFGTAHLDVATEKSLALVDEVYEMGWQPAELSHIVGRRSKSRAAEQFSARLVGHHADLRNARSKAPAAWLDQLPDAQPWRLLGPVGNPVDGWAAVIETLAVLRGLPRVEVLMPRPSDWRAAPPGGSTPSRSTPNRSAPNGSMPNGSMPNRPITSGAGSTAHDPKMLARIRALLAKAEATEFPEEAETFTGKAQELIARYSIDEALLSDPTAHVDVRGRRIPIDDPYSEQKCALLNVCATAQHCRAIWSPDLGFATIVGPPTELELTEMLFTSLLVQAVRAMTAAGQLRHDRSPSFRRAFLVAYAHRISERLEDSNTRVASEIGTALVPVFARQSAAVDSEFSRLFPRTVAGRSRSYDVRGWNAGRAAADEVAITRGQVAR